MGSLAGKIALVTGSTGAIGSAIAMRLAAEGTHLRLLGRDKRALSDLAEHVSATAPLIHVSTVHCDLASSFEPAAERIAADHCDIDILVHSAGAIVPKTIADTTPEDFDSQFQANVRVPYLLSRALLPALRSRKGQIVFINSSVARQKGHAGLAAYTASKTALMAFADSLRDEVNADGIRVLSVYPGRTASRMQEIIAAAEGRPYRPASLLQPEDVANSVLAALLLPRTAEITDIAIRPFRKN